MDQEQQQDGGYCPVDQPPISSQEEDAPTAFAPLAQQQSEMRPAGQDAPIVDAAEQEERETNARLMTGSAQGAYCDSHGEALSPLLGLELAAGPVAPTAKLLHMGLMAAEVGLDAKEALGGERCDPPPDTVITASQSPDACGVRNPELARPPASYDPSNDPYNPPVCR
jgi:hypothetical protein